MLGPADEGSTILLKARKHSPLDTAAPPRRLESAATPLSEPQISHLLIPKYKSQMFSSTSPGFRFCGFSFPSPTLKFEV
jgi:hypothetical protein